ncbi:MAG: HDIG domain-containing protein [Clostridia bacterium]|nr:HDIG domain-containing protein [Clostridia bacterium]
MFFSNRKFNYVYSLNNNSVKAIGSDVNLLDDCLEYNKFVSDLIDNQIVLEMMDYMQHGTTSCYQHCINVSYYSYKLAKKLNLDAKSTARAALLHDLFLYDWHKTAKVKSLFKKHGFTHPKKALENASKYFHLNDKEKDIIIKHMWPLTIVPPKYKESYIVSFMDKYCCLIETFYPKFHKIHFLKKVSYL